MRGILHYKTPAADWTSGLLIGTGRLAGMIFGNGHGERLGLNHELLYSAKYKDRECDPESINHLPEIRRLLKQGKYAEATTLALDTQSAGKMNPGSTQRTDDYKPAGELVIVPDHIENRGYRRCLDLETATARVEYDGVSFDYAADCVLDRIFIHITGALCAKVDLEFRPDPDLRHMVFRDGGCVRAAGEYAGGSLFETRTAVYTDGSFDGSRLTVQKEALLVIDIETGLDGGAAVAARLDMRAFVPDGADYAALIRPHIEKYRSVMDRTVFSIETDPAREELPTDERLRRMKAGEADPGMIRLYFDFVHYLFFAGTVCGRTPMNLQGKWNHLPAPPWHSDYHSDINLEMNYWPAEALGMGDMHLTLMNYLERLVPQAQKCAKTRFGCRGVFISLTDDHWARATTEPPCCNLWPGAAAWYGGHFYRHYQYTGDAVFLRERAYPYMKEVCAFFEDYLEEDANGILQVIPSQSPENHFMLTFNAYNGGNPSVAISSAMDLSLIREILTNSIEAAGILGVDPDKVVLWKEMLDKLQPLKIGSDGRLLEWNEEFDEGMDPGHRHLSHLYGVYPGGFINETDTPELFEAAKASYDYRMARGSGHTGWSRAWSISLESRFRRPDAAYEQLWELITGLSSDSFLNVHPSWGMAEEDFIFQIEGNFGGLAGVLEMLVGVSNGCIRLLPALPRQFGTGSICGLHLPEQAVCDIFWQDGSLMYAEITLGWTGGIRLKGDYITDDPAVGVKYEGGMTVIAAAPGTKVTVRTK